MKALRRFLSVPFFLVGITLMWLCFFIQGGPRAANVQFGAWAMGLKLTTELMNRARAAAKAKA